MNTKTPAQKPDALLAGLRPMRLDDLIDVMNIETRAYPLPWSKVHFEDCLKSGYACFVWEVESVITGYVLMMIAVQECHILNICIDPELQGHGRGRKLMKVAIEIARPNVDIVFLEVRPSNQGAIHLYESLGFHEMGRRPNYYPAQNGREDAILMGKALLFMDE